MNSADDADLIDQTLELIDCLHLLVKDKNPSKLETIRCFEKLLAILEKPDLPSRYRSILRRYKNVLIPILNREN